MGAPQLDIVHETEIPLTRVSPLQYLGKAVTAARAWRYTYTPASRIVHLKPIPSHGLRIWQNSGSIHAAIRRFYQGRHTLDEAGSRTMGNDDATRRAPGRRA